MSSFGFSYSISIFTKFYDSSSCFSTAEDTTSFYYLASVINFDFYDNPEALCALKPRYLNSPGVFLKMPLPYIVTPEHQKRPSDGWATTSIWKEAYDRLGRAAEEKDSKVVVVGYSLPSEDFHARLLMRIGVGACGDDKKMLHIIDPDTKVAARYSSCITPNIKFCQRRFTGDELPKILAEDA